MMTPRTRSSAPTRAWPKLSTGALLAAIALAGAALYAVYFRYTAYYERSYDAGDEVDYVYFIEHNLRLPRADSCSICHHPPLYYVLAALWVHLCRWTHFGSYERSLQALSLVLWLAFVGFALLLVKRFARDRATSALGAALVVFWPYAVMSSVRVHNDVLVTVLTTGSLYFAVRWFEDRRRCALLFATLLAGLGLLTKASAITAVVTLLLLLAVRAARPDSRRVALRQLASALALFGACAWLSVWNKLAVGRVTLCESVFGRACRALRVPSQLAQSGVRSYLCFDLRGFVSEPFLDTYRPETGTNCYWNSLLKSSLFGTYSGSPDALLVREPNRTLAFALDVVLLAMIAYGLLGAVRAARERWVRYRVLLVFSAVSLSFSVGFRVAVPLAHHADFRHVMPLLVPASIFYSAAAHHLGQENRTLGRVGFGLGAAFVVLSIAVFVPK